jgi:bromodomain and PHD finger-containing protein 1
VYDLLCFQDANWLRLINEKRRKKKQTIIPKEIFEQLMDCFEKESFFQPLIEPGHQMPADDDAICCICFDGECHMHNVILFCDLCNLAVHQECYGVPTVPDGPWLCRRCLLSPSHAVSCCLCPSLRGAFKQTDDGRWAHVVCAQWIPAVGFANGVFLEPVDGISRIAPARWKLTCYICKLRGVGACIQCHKPSCYTAFHVTCAMQAGLYMKVERVKDTGPPGPNGNQAPNFKKLAYCDVHYPASLELPSGSQLVTRDEEKAHMHIETEDNMQERFLKNAREIRRLLTEKTPPGPVLSVPVVSPSRLNFCEI